MAVQVCVPDLRRKEEQKEENELKYIYIGKVLPMTGHEGPEGE